MPSPKCFGGAGPFFHFRHTADLPIQWPRPIHARQSIWHPSLRLRILAPAALVAVPAIALIFFISFDRRQQAEHAVTQSAARLASLKTLHQERLVESTRQLLIAISQSRDVREGTPETCSSYLRQVVPQFGTTYVKLGRARPPRQTSLQRPNQLSISVADRTYFHARAGVEDFTVGEYIVGRQSRKPSLPFSYPVLNAEGDVQLLPSRPSIWTRLDESLDRRRSARPTRRSS